MRILLSLLILAGMPALAGSYSSYPGYGDKQWMSTVADVASLPASGNRTGDTRVVKSPLGIYSWSGSGWVSVGGIGSGGGVSYIVASSPLSWNDVSQTMSIAQAATGASGYLSSTDWNTFNGKQDALGFTAVPNTRTVNSHALSGDVVVGPSDIAQTSSYRFVTDTEKSTWNGKQDALGFTAVPSTRTVNSHALSGDVVVGPSDIAQTSSYRFVTDTEKSTWNGKQDALGFTPVANTVTVNSHPLSSSVSVTASDVGLGSVTNDAQIAKSIGTAKGQFIGFTASATPSPVPTSGTDGNVLTENSASGAGFTWTQAIPAGFILPFAGSACPTGWVLANGASVLRSGTYANLFTTISTAYGTADGTHFNLPDFRGKFMRGVDGGAANDPDRASRTACVTGGATGDSVGSCEADAFASHTHTGPNKRAYYSGAGDQSTVANGDNTGQNYAWNTGSTGGNETRPKNVNVNYCIKF